MFCHRKRLVSLSLLLLALFGSTLQAQFVAEETILPFRPDHLTVDGLDVYYHFPSGTPAEWSGILYFFHGGKGTARSGFQKVEMAALLGDAVEQGYAIICPESTIRRHHPEWRNWVFPEPDRPWPAAFPAAWKNGDEIFIRRLHDHFFGTDGDSLPVFLVGHSSGGRFASAMGLLLRQSRPFTKRTLNVRAVAVFANTGSRAYFGNHPDRPHRDYPTPVLFNHAANDPLNPVEEIEDNARHLHLSGVPVQLNRSERQPLRADRMARIVGISYAQSRQIYRILHQGGYLTADRLVRAGAFDYLRATSEYRWSRAQWREIDRQLNVLNAGHSFMSDFNASTFRFFAAHRD